MKLRTWSRETAVSPVVAVILLVAVTVTLSAVVGGFALNLGQSATSGSQSDLGVQTTSDGSSVTATIVTGDADEVNLLVNGTTVDTVTDASAGDTLTATNVSPDATVSVVTTSDDSSTVVSSQTASETGVSSTDSTTNSGLSGPVLIDSFEDDTFSAYTITATDRGTPTNTSSTSTNGTDSLILEVSASSGDNAELYSSSGDGLEAYPEPGTTTTLDVKTNASSTGSSWVYFGGQNASNAYVARIKHDGGEYAIYGVEEGNRTLLANKSFSTTANQWYRMNITWKTNGNITTSLNNQSGSQLVRLQTTNTTYSNGLVGFRRDLYSGTVATWYDNVTVAPAD